MSIKKFFKDSFFVTGLVFISRVLGWLRDVCLLSYLGTSALSDAFNMSVKIPSAFRKIVSDGALNTALLPLIRDFESKKKSESTRALIANLFMFLSVLLILLYLIEQFNVVWVVSKIAPGFNAEQFTLYCCFTKITSLSSFVFFCYSLCCSLLHSKQSFFFPAFAGIIYNISLIFFVKISVYLDTGAMLFIYLYLISVFLMFFSVFLPCIYNVFFDENVLYKVYFLIFLSTFMLLFIFSSFKFQCLLFLFLCCFYCVVIYKYELFLYFKDLKDFFFLFAPVFFISVFGQIGDLIMMSYGSLFPPGSMTLVVRSLKVVTMPISFIVPFFVILFSYLNRLGTKEEGFLLKKISFFMVLIISFAFSSLCIIFPEYLLHLVFFGKIKPNDIELMVPIVKLCVCAIPAILMSKLIQLFLFVEKKNVAAFVDFIFKHGFLCFGY